MTLGTKLAALVLAYPCWLVMLSVHELGHVICAWLSGGRIESMVIPLLGFSQTVLSHNPHPVFVAAGGSVWGALLPVALAVAVGRAARNSAAPMLSWVRGLAWAFAGFCCVANGAYLTVGGWLDGTDAADLRRGGVPIVALVLVGAVFSAVGLAIWHFAAAIGQSAAEPSDDAASPPTANPR